ncbi:lipoprotein GNA1870 like protein, partial [Aggregatibacter sp. oral taxon 458 str. W10330]|uniref:Slam-dependent surface lipoprotein n=1 Tax=Aggregatibacter sp. oral taxon 458 TaxID=712148 RepID=UPI00039780D3
AEEARQAEEARKAEEARIAQKTAELIEQAKAKGLNDDEAKQFAQNNINNEDDVSKANLDNMIKIKDLTKLAIAEGLNEHQAADFAKNNVDLDEDTAKANLETLIINNAKGIYNGQYRNGLTTNQYGTSSSSSSGCTNGRCYSVEETITTGKAIYNQPYSIIVANTKSGVRNYSPINELSNVQITGLKTKLDAIPTEGTANYSGKAFDAKNNGALDYNVNFANKTGSGTITGLGNNITLEQGSISGSGISSSATQGYKSGSYSLDFFGKNAEEIGGKVTLDGKDAVGFGGTRGEIQK